jgi:hypothetical protein
MAIREKHWADFSFSLRAPIPRPPVKKERDAGAFLRKVRKLGRAISVFPSCLHREQGRKNVPDQALEHSYPSIGCQKVDY